ncbi:MAG: hypothetical protein IT221_11985 [Fluviicola sp.]|nr:hypothetical protein [Fluviicola sp.]
MKVFILSLIHCIFFTIQAQEFKSYYKNIYQADSLAYVGKNKEALLHYQQTFSSVAFPYCRDLQSAYLLAIKVKNYKLAKNIAQQLLFQSGEIKLINTKDKSFKKTDQYKELENSTDSILKCYNERINHSYIQLLDSLTYVDQYIIRNNKSHKGNYKIDLKSLPENRFELDQKNFELLMKWVDSLGFPSESAVGYKTYNDDVWVLFHHNLREKQNEKYHLDVLKWIENGWYHPNSMMIWYEQYAQQHLKTTYFTTWDQNLDPENIKRINKNRSKYYLKSLNAYSIEKNGRSMISKG